MQRPGGAVQLAMAVVAVVLAASAGLCRGQLAGGFYDGKCGNSSVETVIHDAVQARLAWDKRMCGGARYEVQLGRRDGTVSQAYMAAQLPGPDVDIPTAIDMFAKKGLNSFDMAILMGAHTVGVTHCSLVKHRLHDFNGTGKPDPSMDPLYVWILTTFACPSGQTFDNIVYLDDPSSILTVDRSYYSQILKRRGVLDVDQKLGDNGATAWMVQFLGTTDFFPSMFGYALNKLAAVDVKTGAAGEIRTNCRRTN
ncbi:hypothetical protein ABZP36_011589 [Zizania latifolia]